MLQVNRQQDGDSHAGSLLERINGINTWEGGREENRAVE